MEIKVMVDLSEDVKWLLKGFLHTAEAISNATPVVSDSTVPTAVNVPTPTAEPEKPKSRKKAEKPEPEAPAPTSLPEAEQAPEPEPEQEPAPKQPILGFDNVKEYAQEYAEARKAQLIKSGSDASVAGSQSTAEIRELLNSFGLTTFSQLADKPEIMQDVYNKISEMRVYL